MKMIKTTSDGYINADKIEAYCVEYSKTTGYYYINAYTPTYALEESCTKYVLEETKSKLNAYKRLDALAEWLGDHDEDGAFDCMHVWESDYDDPN